MSKPLEGWLFPNQLWSREELSEENMKKVIFVRQVPKPIEGWANVHDMIQHDPIDPINYIYVREVQP